MSAVERIVLPPPPPIESPELLSIAGRRQDDASVRGTRASLSAGPLPGSGLRRTGSIEVGVQLLRHRLKTCVIAL